MQIINRVNHYDNDEIYQLLLTDPLNRKKHLLNIINIFQNINTPIVLGIDGDWGTGKTIFLRQLEYLINNQLPDTMAMDENLKEFKKKHQVFYFNSWENDIYTNPLQSLLFNLSKDKKTLLDEQGYDVQNILNIGKYIANIALKASTKGSLELDDFIMKKSSNTLDSIITIDQIKSELKKFLEVLTKNKVLIIIIDELDRCKPMFAIELLEIVKHYFLHDNVHFILCSNKAELTHTVKNYYGNGFNGYEYLDRFIDFEYYLPEPIKKDYYYNTLNQKNKPYTYLAVIIIEHFNLSLRQINKYVLYTELSFSIWDKSWDNNKTHLMLSYYLLGLKIKNITEYNQFLKGNGLDKLSTLVEHNSHILDRFINSENPSTELSSLQKLEIEYNSIFNQNNSNNSNGKLSSFLKLLSYIK